MNRLRRKNRRHRLTKRIWDRLSPSRPLPASSLVAEPLESRLLLTTITLPAGATTDTIFDYADPEGSDPGSEVSNFNEMRIGTLSGLPPEQDIVVEILNYRGEDIPGDLTIDGVTTSPGGGPGGVRVIEPIPPDTLGALGFSINALATNSSGQTYGLTNNGLLVSVDTNNGTTTILGAIQDVDTVAAKGNLIDFDILGSSFEAADFDPISDLLYAVVTGPTAFDATGEVIAVGQVLITINLDSGGAEPLGEADPAGRDPATGVPDYRFSRIGTALNSNTITTIVYSEEPGDNTTNTGTTPVFLGFESGFIQVDENIEELSRFVKIRVTPTSVPGIVTVSTSPIAVIDGAEIIEGLAYGNDADGNRRLFGLHGGDANELVLVDLAFDPDTEEILSPIIEYGENEREEQIQLTGMSYDNTNDVAFATDPVSNTLYRITTISLAEDEESDGELVIVGSLADIFMVYVASSTADVFITFTFYTLDDELGKVYQPTGGDPAFLYVDEDDSDVFTPEEAGGVMIGTQPVFRPDEEEPVWSGAPTFFNADATAPNPGPHGAYPGGDFRPGIIVAADAQNRPQNIGRIQVGGGLFGDVVIHGSIDRLYAGYLATNRIDVDGDLNQLVVATEAGGRVEGDNSWMPVDEAIVDVRGEMGSFYGKGDWGLPVRVLGRDDAPSFPGVLNVNTGLFVKTLREIEWHENDPASDPPLTVFPLSGLDEIITNDSPYTAEYLGSVTDTISVVGGITDPTWDSADFYSFGLMAGQTVEIGFFNTMGWANFGSGHPALPDSQELTPGLSLLDPDLKAVGSLTTDLLTGQFEPLTFTAEQAGIYTIAVGEPSSGISGIAGTYRIDITGASPATLGGGNILTNFRGTDRDEIVVASGNLSAVSVGGIMRGTNIMVNEGSAGGIRAGFNAFVPLSQDSFSGTAEAIDEVPAYGYFLEITIDGEHNIFPEASITVNGDIGMISAAVRSMLTVSGGSDIQSFFIDGNYVGLFAADDNIGQFIVTEGYGPAMIGEFGDELFGIIPGIFANADGVGRPGVIDSILVGGDFGRSSEDAAIWQEVPVSTGPRGGNVRYVQIGGGIIQTTGGLSTPQFGPFSFDPGQSVVIQDDSGAQVHISPGFVGQQFDEFPFVLGPLPGADGDGDGDGDGQADDTTSTGGILTVKLLPIRDQLLASYLQSHQVNQTLLGYAIVEINSTDGLRLTSTGGPVEVGLITAEGVQDNSVIINGFYPISVLQTHLNGAAEGTEGQGITRLINATLGGDMVSVIVGLPDIAPPAGFTAGVGTPIQLISLKGNLGTTVTTTGQIITSLAPTHLLAEETITVISMVNEVEPDDDEVHDNTVIGDPGGFQKVGLVSASDIDTIWVTGSLADTDIRGNVGTIIINYDKSRNVGQFDGVTGPIIIYGDLDRIDLGDGIPNVGSGRFAQNGVFVYGALGTAEISGAGRDIAGPIFAQASIERIRVTDGARITHSHVASAFGERVQNVQLIHPTIAVTNEFDDYQPIWGYVNFGSIIYGFSGSIGSIEVTGRGSEMNGASIHATSIGTINVNAGASGMFHSRIQAHGFTTTSMGRIGRITVGGQGIHDTQIIANRELGNVTVLNGGVIEDSEIRGDLHIGTISAPQINRTDIDAINKLDSVSVTQDIFDLVIEVGELGRLYSPRSILGSGIFVSGPVGSIQTGGDLISSIEVTGPFGDLRQVIVGGDLGTPNGGEIIVDGKIGTIMVTGDFLAGLLLNWDPTPFGPNNPLGPHQKYPTNGIVLSTLRAGGRVALTGDIGGNVGTIMSGGDFGVFGSDFNVHGDLRMLMVGPNGQSDLQGNLTVTNNLGTVFVFGSVNGQTNVVGNYGSLLMIGRGADRADLNASIDVGGNFGSLTIIHGDISDIDIVDGGPLEINVAGAGPRITIIGSDIDGQVVVDGGPGLDIDGSINGSYVSTGDIDSLVLGGDISENAVVVIDGNLGQLIVAGDIEGRVHVTGNIGSIQAANMGLADVSGITATITAGGNIGSVSIAGEMVDSYIVAGFDPGLVSPIGPGLFGANELTIDGTDIDPNETAMAGSINSIFVGILNNSVLAAGISPGENNIFGDVDGSDRPGTGLSRIGAAVIGSALGDGTPFGVFADSEITALQVNGAPLTIPVSLPSGFRAWTIAEPAIPLPPGATIQQGLPFIADIGGRRVIILMTGPGSGTVLPGVTQIDSITLTGTNRATNVIVLTAAANKVDVGRVTTGDDESLNMLLIDGRISNPTSMGSLQIGGNVNTLRLGGVGNATTGGEVTIEGFVTSADLGTLSATPSSVTEIDILGNVNRLTVGNVTSNVFISAVDIDNITARGTFAGSIEARNGKVSRVLVFGQMNGVISADEDMDNILVLGVTSGTFRAGEDIISFQSTSMNTGIVAAGGNFRSARITGDMAFSILAAGVDIGPEGIIDPADIAGQGDLQQVWIGGDFVQSNIVAGLAAGQDGFFGTNDDRMENTTVEDINAPQVVDVNFPDVFTIAVTFSDPEPQQGEASDIGTVTILGQVQGSGFDGEQFAIAASGEVKSVMANRQAFDILDNVLRVNAGNRGILASTIETDGIDNLQEALAASFRVRTDGFDHIFGTDDDIFIFGDENPLTDPTVSVSFDESTSTASFHNSQGFAPNLWGSNYFEIVLDAAAITNRQSVQLDGEYLGQWPTGDGIPGNNDFVYRFAVGDIGDSVLTAYAPFADTFPANVTWDFTSRLGDNLRLTAANALDDRDMFLLNGLEAGQILVVELTGRSAAWDFDDMDLILRHISSDEQTIGPLPVTGTEIGFPRPLVVPDLSELAFAGDTFYAFEDRGQQFYTLTVDASGADVTRLPNNLADLNRAVASQGTILGIEALAGQSADSLWAVADFRRNAAIREDVLVLITRISDDLDNIDPTERVRVSVAAQPLGFNDIVGITELNGTLYGVNAVAHADGTYTNTLVTIDSNPVSADFGVAQQVVVLDNNQLALTGLALNPNPQDVTDDGLVVLHDQPAEGADNLLVDSIYTVSPQTGQTDLLRELSQTNFDQIFSGLTAQPGGMILVGQPLLGSPIGDQIEIRFDTLGTQNQVFGTALAGSFSNFGGGNTVSSRTTQVPENALGQQFINSGFYYAFDITYDAPPGAGVITIDISDIDFLNGEEISAIQAVGSDDPNNVTVTITDAMQNSDTNSLSIEIDADSGDGDVTVFFAGTSSITALTTSDVELAGAVVGFNARTDLTPQRAMVMPALDEFSISTQTLATELTLDLTPTLDAALALVLPAALMDDIRSGITEDSFDDVVAVLVLAGEDELLDSFLDATDTIRYDAIGYDSQQEIFALINTTSLRAIPLMVTDPAAPADVTPLTVDVLSDIFAQNVNANITITAINAFDFGGFDEDLIAEELWVVVTVDDTFTGQTRDSLLRIADILNPAAGMTLSNHDLNLSGQDLDVTSLAFGNVGVAGDVGGSLYGIDSNTQTLIKLDNRLFRSGNSLIANTAFGTVFAVGGQLDNLADPGNTTADFTGLDFDSNNRLIAVDNDSDFLLEISTDLIVHDNVVLAEQIQRLPAGQYSSLSYDPNGFMFGNQAFGSGMVVRQAAGSPLDIDPLTPGNQPDTMTIAVDSGFENHTFGSVTNFTSGPVQSVSSALGNTPVSVAAAGGFYRFDVVYTRNQGDIFITIDDIDWPADSSGQIVAVDLSDDLNALVDTFNGDSFTVRIDSNSGTGTLTIFFAASAEMLVPAADVTQDTTVNVPLSASGETIFAQIPDDGDYVLQVGTVSNFGGDDPVTYDLALMLFNDGNGDFGVGRTASGILYDAVMPNAEPVDLNTDSTNLDDYLNHPFWPIDVEGSLTPGQAGTVVVDASLENFNDTDVYTLNLIEGQRITVDIDSETLFGRDTAGITVGIYNGDLEAITTISKIGGDDVVSNADDLADPIYTAQAIFQMPNHQGLGDPILDPMTPNADGLFEGTYYVVVSGASTRDAANYRLKIDTTAAPDPTNPDDPNRIQTPPSQLVWLNFEGGTAEYLTLVSGFAPNVANRPVFNAGDFNLQNMRQALLLEIADRIEQAYRDAGLTENEIQFTLNKPALGTTYSTVFISGRTPSLGLFGIAETVDRDNSVRQDAVSVFSGEIAAFYMGDGAMSSGPLDGNSVVRFDQVATLLSNTGAHELGHILGLEHATELAAAPNNLMGYNDALVTQEFEERNVYWYQPIGFTNEIDLLLRNIGSGTSVGV